MTLGFLGTGAITEAIVTGLSMPGGPAQPIRLSPRNPSIAAGLAARFENVTVCASNQAVLDTCDTIILAVRPQITPKVLSELHFAPTHTVISLVAGFSAVRIAGLVAPSAAISRAIPLPSVAQRRSPIAVYPPQSVAASLFAPLGQVFGIETEAHLNALSTATSTMAAYFGFMGQISSWVAAKGIPEQQARQYIAQLFAGLAGTGLEESGQSPADLAAAHSTPGGLNEQLLRHLTDHGVFQTLTDALDAVHRRASGMQPLPATSPKSE
ncbi:pyrroline-5-carboxylate reductase [Paludibaculum fermentans]|uniref:NAD(P)-binding domain-containing protein n=1 Tax=Paludibaculum fermentans TaxID=1473598 RepID=A0A7S7SLG3_PALFE|nr:pyrroline-5-carboxylate reductase [Paludibaculum fermentans]QOY88015.1 NAD(P)-binding domain-containing protein [Paludibaculum fermentans]